MPGGPGEARPRSGQSGFSAARGCLREWGVCFGWVSGGLAAWRMLVSWWGGRRGWRRSWTARGRLAGGGPGGGGGRAASGARAGRACGGRRGVVWIEGEAGAGKTALLRAAVAVLAGEFEGVRAQGEEVGAGVCFDGVAQL